MSIKDKEGISLNLLELLQETTWEEVEKSLSQYCDEDALIFKSLYNNLKNRKEERNDEEISVMIDFIEEENVYDVFGTKPNDKNKYSLSLSSWDEWLQYNISNSLLEKLNPNEIISHCLWEMTFYGLEEEKVLLKKEELLYASDKIKRKEYIEEISICPFCNGTKVKEDNEICTLCDETGHMSVINFR